MGSSKPSFDLANSFRTSDGLPLLDNSYNGDGKRLVNDQGLGGGDDFTPDAGPRRPPPRPQRRPSRYSYLGWGPHPGFPFIRDQPYAGPYSPKKFVYYAGQEGTLSDGTSWTRGYGSMNYNIIRFADLILQLAEAEIETGNLDAALELINEVRSRAANESGFITNEDGTPAANYEIEEYDDFSNADQARTALYFERKLELSGEGHRFFDLRRWGIAKSELDRIICPRTAVPARCLRQRRIRNSPGISSTPSHRLRSTCRVTEVLSQNPGY